MDVPQRGKRLKRGRGHNKPGQQQQQQQRQAGTQRSENALITESQRNEFARLGEDSKYSKRCPLTVSTRGIGLMISRVTSVLRKRLRLPSEDIPVAAIYRASLAQLQAKMCFLQSTHMLNNFREFEYESPWESFANFDTANMIRQGHHYNLSPVALIIDSVGNGEINDKTFTPVFSRNSNALNIRLDNLREYCERMSKVETDPLERIEGYELNSIPNAKWERIDENDERSIVLKNPDEIIPPDYDCKDTQTVFNDLLVTDRFCYGKLRFDMEEFAVRIDNGNNGNPGMLVSTCVIPGQSVKVNDGKISGNQKEFWSSEPITNEFGWVGALGLVGEVFNPTDGSSRSNVGGMRIVVDWDQLSRMAVY